MPVPFIENDCLLIVLVKRLARLKVKGRKIFVDSFFTIGKSSIDILAIVENFFKSNLHVVLKRAGHGAGPNVAVNVLCKNFDAGRGKQICIALQRDLHREYCVLSTEFLLDAVVCKEEANDVLSNSLLVGRSVLVDAKGRLTVVSVICVRVGRINGRNLKAVVVSIGEIVVEHAGHEAPAEVHCNQTLAKVVTGIVAEAVVTDPVNDVHIVQTGDNVLHSLVVDGSCSILIKEVLTILVLHTENIALNATIVAETSLNKVAIFIADGELLCNLAELIPGGGDVVLGESI